MNDALRDLVTTPERADYYLRSGLWDDSRLLERIAAHAAANPAAHAVLDEHSVTAASYGKLESDSSRVAALLLERGIEAGDIVAVQLPNWYASVAIAVGALKAGAVVNPMLPSYRERELRHMLGLGGTRAIFTPALYRSFDHAGLVGRLRGELPHLRHHFVVSPCLDDLAGLPAEPAPTVVRARPAGAVVELIFTSGTESEPKAVMHTERTLNCNLRATWAALGMSSSDSVWMPAPIGHSTGFNHGLRLALYHGLPLVLQDVWDPVQGAQIVERHRPTHTLLSATFLRDLTGAARQGAGDVSSLRLFGCGGAVIPPETVAEAKEVGIGCLRLYGATEFLVATWNTADSGESQRTSTDGRPVPGVEIEVRDSSGVPVVGRTGDIYVRSASGSVGFYRDERRTLATYADGWIRSGDLGVVDADGYLSVTGRRKEIIIRGGLNIAPREIEEVIQQLAGVRSVAVVGVSDDRLGEITCAFVVLAPGSGLTFEQMTSGLQVSGLARFKWPQRLEIVDEMPTTATGKIRKHELLARLQQAGKS
jgi:cyclohexanecarboxylate-CoA ligase